MPVRLKFISFSCLLSLMSFFFSANLWAMACQNSLASIEPFLVAEAMSNIPVNTTVSMDQENFVASKEIEIARIRKAVDSPLWDPVSKRYPNKEFHPASLKGMIIAGVDIDPNNFHVQTFVGRVTKEEDGMVTIHRHGETLITSLRDPNLIFTLNEHILDPQTDAAKTLTDALHDLYSRVHDNQYDRITLNEKDKAAVKYEFLKQAKSISAELTLLTVSRTINWFTHNVIRVFDSILLDATTTLISSHVTFDENIVESDNYFLNVPEAFNLMLTDYGDDIDPLTQAFNRSGGRSYQLEIVQKISNHFQLQALLTTFRLGLDVVGNLKKEILAINNELQLTAFYEVLKIEDRRLRITLAKSAVKVGTLKQLEPFLAGIRADIRAPRYFEEVALNVSTEEQLMAIRQLLKLGNTNIDDFLSVVRAGNK